LNNTVTAANIQYHNTPGRPILIPNTNTDTSGDLVNVGSWQSHRALHPVNC